MMVSERQARIGRGRVALAAAIMAALIGGGNALAETQSRDVSGFDRITFALPGSLTVSRGETFELSIDADSEDLERIETEVDGSALRIGWDEGMFGLFGGKPEGPIHVRVSLPALQALEVAGSGDVDAGNWLAESSAPPVRRRRASTARTSAPTTRSSAPRFPTSTSPEDRTG
jgi:hypothetical protein